MDMNRRDFLKGAAVTGALVAGGALAGCSPSKGGSSSAGKGSTADWAQRLNVDIASTLPGNTSEKVDVKETKTCDVAVIGAGCSGVNTAVRAAEAGLKVILVEKTESIGGASLMSFAPMAYNSKIGLAAGGPIDTEPIIEQWVADSHWRVNASAIRQLVNTSGEAVDWMVDNGWTFTPMPGGAVMLPAYDKREPLFKDMLAKYVEPTGEVLTKTTAKHLVVDKDGAVTGVVVVDGSNKGIQIDAKAVVIATGGYAGNADMVEAAFDFNGVFAGLPQDIGEGLEMAWAAGAQKPQNFGGQMLHQTLAKATDSLIPQFDAFPAKYPMILTYVGNLLNVGSSGVRFRNEALALDAVPAANSSTYQGFYHYVIVSQTMLDILEKQGLVGLGVDYKIGMPPEYKPKFELDTPWDNATAVFDKMAEGDGGFKGDTVEDLAKAAGMDPVLFTKQFEEYEGFCSTGVDTQFGKAAQYLKSLGDGPYYAITTVENNLCSWGGLLTNTDYQVLDYDRIPVPGLYAVGNEAGTNLYNDTYVGKGVGMGNTITSGYICGGKLGETLK